MDFIMDPMLDQKYDCCIYRFKSSEESAALNQYMLCMKNGIKTECCDTESEDVPATLLDGQSSTRLKLHVKEEEIEIGETTISGLFSSSDLKDVKWEAPDETLLKRSSCGYQAIQPVLLKEQMKVHEQITKRRVNLIISHTETKQFKCSKCSYTSVSSGSLKVHRRRHRGNKPFKCTICDYASARSGSLKVHMRRHTGDKPFKCTLCDYASAQSANLITHMRMHTRDKPFKCTICDYASVTSSHVKVHMRQHTGKRPFKCTVCNYASVESGHLKVHMRKHTGHKPFKCAVCDYASAYSDTFKRHMKRHTGEKPFECTICTYASAHSSNLKGHMKRWHTA